MKEQTLAVQRMQDYIEQNLTKDIRLSDLAQVSLFSPWYSYRLFRDYLGLTPVEYIRRLRLARAAVRLREENSRVIDIAFDLGFSVRFSESSDATQAIMQRIPCRSRCSSRTGQNTGNSERRKSKCQICRQFLFRSSENRSACASLNGAQMPKIIFPTARKSAAMSGASS